MLTSELQKKIDKKWDACWPLNLLKPIAILDLISYLFFLKKLSGNHLNDKESSVNTEVFSPHAKEKEIIESGWLGELEAESLHSLLTSEKGSYDLLKNYTRSLAFGVFVKGGLQIAPTQKLLANAVDILELIGDQPKNEKGEIFDYLLYKKELIGPNGQAYLPEYLVNLIVSVIEPNDKDFILDVCVGDGSLLVECAKYIKVKNPELNSLDPQKFIGLESDLTSFRIAGMNMILNGIHNPELKAIDTPGLNSVTTGHPTIIVANLIFSGSENKMIVEGGSIKEATRKEILYLNFIIKNASNGTRIVVIVPDIILYNNVAEFVALRQEIMDRFKVEAVISLNDKAVLSFFGTSILIFRKEIPTMADRVWFYKMKYCKEADKNEKIVSENKIQNDISAVVTQPDELDEILNHFKNNNQEESKSTDGFFIDAKDIREKNYCLSYNEFNLFIGQEKAINLSEINHEEKKEAITNLKKQTLFPVAEKLREPKKNPVKKIISICFFSIVILGIGFVTYWFLYLKKDLNTPKKHSAAPVGIVDSVKPVTNSVTIDSSGLNHTNQNSKVSDSAVSHTSSYTVGSDKAYFYLSPDTNTRRDVFINNRVNAVLIPEQEKNGFVYVVYVNKRGQSTHGWLRKEDLKPLP